jgi:hypothetical protein
MSPVGSVLSFIQKKKKAIIDEKFSWIANYWSSKFSLKAEGSNVGINFIINIGSKTASWQ